MLLVDCHKKFLSYLRLERDCSKLTIISYRIDFWHFLDFLEHESVEPELENITTPLIREFITYMAQDLGFSANSIRRRIHSLKSFFKFCQSQEYIDKDPTLGISVPKKRQTIPVYITQEDLETLLRTVLEQGSPRTRVRDWLILRTFALTGIRRQELINLEWRDISFRDGTLTVRSGKGNKDRVIPLPPELITDLRMFKDAQSGPITEHTPVFRSVTGKKLGPRPVNTMFEKYVKFAGLEGKNYTLHKIRHSFATFLLQQNVSLVEIQELLGHADISSTRVYLHTNPSRLKNAVLKNPILHSETRVLEESNS
ncbi:MAG: tyrosine-type recombinase/integrase [Alicyclobacillus herbarius]|uniref:tyrosine-type recombinase/integrase n=1 Tax=Alicyclobacillus herbarius TaxID=122960 RepID=UPI002354DF62|nr:tyrosine-type recombinase/integrase [Alicyclobacillus herbarius]MCL6633240.1 tyrosine-type recombinase/integrase [Alicyclobacillus herbarius]